MAIDKRLSASGDDGDSILASVFTPLDGFEGRQHKFTLDRRLGEQLVDLCKREGWQPDSRHKDENSPPVLLHGVTGFMLSDMELPRVGPQQELRLAGALEELEKIAMELTKEKIEVATIEALAHNARPESAYLAAVVQAGALERLWECRPTSCLEWEAVLAAISALMEDDEAQVRVTRSLLARKSSPFVELCLRALDCQPTGSAVTYALVLLRHALTKGDKGLEAVYRAEAELRASSELDADINFTRDIVELVADGDMDALQLMIDATAQCRGKHFLRFVEEARIEAKQASVESILAPIFEDTATEDRCKRIIKLCVTSRLRLLSQTAGVVSAQAAREMATQRELLELRARLKTERERVEIAGREIRRLTAAVREMSPFLDIHPRQMKESVQKLCENLKAASSLQWRKKYTPLHLAAELGLVNYVPMLLALGASPTAKDYRGQTPKDVAKAYGHKTVVSLLATSEAHGTSFLRDEDKSIDQGCCWGLGASIRRNCSAANYWRKRFCTVMCCCRRKHIIVGEDGSRNAASSNLDESSGIQLADTRRYVGRDGLRTVEEEEDDDEDDLETGLGALKGQRLRQYIRLLEEIGEDLLERRLASPPELGGLNLSAEDAKLGVEIIKKAAEDEKRALLESMNDVDAHEALTTPDGGGKGGKGKDGKGSKDGGGKDGKGKGKKGPGGPGKGDGKKGGGKGKLNLTKPAFKPPKAMKPMWWSRIIVDPSNQAASKSVWKDVKDIRTMLDGTDFCETFCQPARSVGPKDGAADSGEAAPPATLQIIKDPKVILAKEVAFKMLPKPLDVATALQELDSTTLTIDRLIAIRDHGQPSDEEVFLMNELRSSDTAAERNTPWALPESYLWAVSQVPIFRARLKCLMCIMSYKDQLTPVLDELEGIKAVCQSLRSSSAVRDYLACILACGNFLNGGTNRGQADGFEIEHIGRLHLVKDAKNEKDLRYWMNGQLSQPNGIFKETGPKLLADLKSLTGTIQRRMTKGDAGVVVHKKIKGSVDELGSVLSKLRSDFEEGDELLQASLRSSDLDPVDPFCLELPGRFEEAKDQFDQATQALEAAKAEYKRIQAYFMLSGKSDEFFLMWDEALFGKDIMELPRKAKGVSQELCLDQPVRFEAFSKLWDFSEPPPKPHESKERGSKAAARSSKATTREGRGTQKGSKSKVTLGKELDGKIRSPLESASTQSPQLSSNLEVLLEVRPPQQMQRLAIHQVPSDAGRARSPAQSEMWDGSSQPPTLAHPSSRTALLAPGTEVPPEEPTGAAGSARMRTKSHRSGPDPKAIAESTRRRSKLMKTLEDSGFVAGDSAAANGASVSSDDDALRVLVHSSPQTPQALGVPEAMITTLSAMTAEMRRKNTEATRRGTWGGESTPGSSRRNSVESGAGGRFSVQTPSAAGITGSPTGASGFHLSPLAGRERKDQPDRHLPAAGRRETGAHASSLVSAALVRALGRRSVAEATAEAGSPNSFSESSEEEEVEEERGDKIEKKVLDGPEMQLPLLGDGN